MGVTHCSLSDCFTVHYVLCMWKFVGTKIWSRTSGRTWLTKDGHMQTNNSKVGSHYLMLFSSDCGLACNKNVSSAMWTWPSPRGDSCLQRGAGERQWQDADKMSKAAQLVRNAGNWALIVYHFIGPLFLQLAVTRFVFFVCFFIAADAVVGIYRNTVISKFI